MDTQLLERLRQHLANISTEQFQAEWSEIESMGFQGISVEEFLQTLFTPPTISIIKSPEYSPSFSNDNFYTNVGQEPTFANAA